MTVQNLIDTLNNVKDKNAQVLDSVGNRILYGVERDGKLYLEAIETIDLADEIEDSLRNYNEEGLSEYDAFLELGERGFKLSDFEGTDMYDYVMEFTKTHSWER